MRRITKMVGVGLKYATLSFAGGFTLSFGYLQFINHQVGSIEVDKPELVKFYMQRQKMDQDKANKMYYWVLFDISMMRVMTYHSYASYCEKLRRRVIDPAINKYEDKGIFAKIEKEEGKKEGYKKKALFKEINLIRADNMNTISENEYIMKELRKQQKLMDTRKLLGLDSQNWQKLEKVHKFICETGLSLKDPQVVQYLSHLADIQRRLPGDVLHKIMFI